MIWPSAPVKPFQNDSVMFDPPGLGAAAAAGAVVAAGAAAGLVGSAAAGAAAGFVGSAGLAGAAVGAAVGAAAWPQAVSSAAAPTTNAVRTNARRDVRIAFLPLFRYLFRLC